MFFINLGGWSLKLETISRDIDTLEKVVQFLIFLKSVCVYVQFIYTFRILFQISGHWV